MRSRMLDKDDEREVRSGLRAGLALVASIAGFILVDRLITPLNEWMIVAVIASCLGAAMLLRKR